MKIYLDCIPCQQRQMLKILRLSTHDTRLHEEVLRESVSHLSRITWDTDPMSLMKQTYDMVTRATGITDPYRALKEQSNHEVLQLYPELQQCVQHSDDPLLTACKLAVAGNIMDFGAKDHFNIQETIQHVLTSDFAVNQYERFRTSLHQASNLLFFADNAGEIVLDKLLLETILEHSPVKKLTVVVKETPILNDATLNDVRQIGLDTLPGVEFRLVNTRSNGHSAWMPEHVESWIAAHDVVISKGQANYETLSEYQGVFFLLIAKCPIIAYDTGTYDGALIFKYT